MNTRNTQRDLLRETNDHYSDLKTLNDHSCCYSGDLKSFVIVSNLFSSFSPIADALIKCKPVENERNKQQQLPYKSFKCK